MDSINTSSVPCNSCRMCCIRDAVRLLQGDNAQSYETEPHPYFPGELMLSHKENGECVYLDDSGCSIHNRKPRQCREMDCRNIFNSMSKNKAQKIGIRKIWDQGRILSLNVI